jgi:hypothetical protein
MQQLPIGESNRKQRGNIVWYSLIDIHIHCPSLTRKDSKLSTIVWVDIPHISRNSEARISITGLIVRHYSFRVKVVLVDFWFSVQIGILFEVKIEDVRQSNLISLLGSYCMDHMKNQDESDIDCGGIKCPKCENMKSCKADCDCISDVCKNNKCIRECLIFINFKHWKFFHFSGWIMWR